MTTETATPARLVTTVTTATTTATTTTRRICGVCAVSGLACRWRAAVAVAVARLLASRRGRAQPLREQLEHVPPHSRQHQHPLRNGYLPRLLPLRSPIRRSLRRTGINSGSSSNESSSLRRSDRRVVPR